MVVSYDYVYPIFFCEFYLLHGADAKVYGYQKLHFLINELLDCLDIEPVAFGISLGNIYFVIFVADFFEKIRKHNCAGYAVAVVVGIDNNFLFFFYSFKDSFTGLFHIPKKKRVMKIPLIVGI